MSKPLANANAFTLEGNETGILLIHGFNGSPQNMRYLGEGLAKAGYTISAPLLSAHGTTVEAMETVHYQDWINDVETAYKALQAKCKQIFVAGLSMGGTLALNLAKNHPEITGVIPINATVGIKSGLKDKIAELKTKGLQFVDSGNDIKDSSVAVVGYNQTSVKSYDELIAIADYMSDNLKPIVSPLLVILSMNDNVTHPANSDRIFTHVTSKRRSIVKLDNSYHMATLDNDKDLVIEKIIEFIKKTV